MAIGTGLRNIECQVVWVYTLVVVGGVAVSTNGRSTRVAGGMTFGTAHGIVGSGEGESGLVVVEGGIAVSGRVAGIAGI